jgi:thiosulfate dehydrogenase (quinone) large subunit
MTLTHTPRVPDSPAALADYPPHDYAIVETDEPSHTETRSVAAGRYVMSALRMSLGFVFLWAFLDKLIGLDRATPSERAWLNGGSPTSGFLRNVDGTFAGFFNGLAGNTLLDWLFMVGLLGIGVALMLGIGMRVAAVTAPILLVLMWAADLPLANNPFMDDHLIYALAIVGLALTHTGDWFGLGHWWSRTALVRRVPALR